MTTRTTSLPGTPDAISEDRLRTALSPRARPAKPGPVAVSLTFGWRALLKIKHVPEQLMDVTVFPIMFTLMFTYLFGGAIAGSTSAYLQYLLPGVLVQGVIIITMYTGMTLNDDIQKGVFDRFRSLPVWRPAFLVGALLGDTARFGLASAIIIGLGLILGFRPDGGASGLVLGTLVVLAFAFGLSWIWITLGFIMRTPQSLMAASMMVMFPLTFVSNIFVQPETMPSWLEAFVNVNPVSQLATAVRGLMHGDIETTALTVSLLSPVGLTAIFAPITMYLYRNKK